MDNQVKRLTDEWLRLDKNEHTRRETTSLLEDENYVELGKRMLKRIEFGTAGLRAKMEAGWSRMNHLTVIQASQGLCAYTLREVNDAKAGGVVIGYDHRHHSREWAELVAMVFLNSGFKVYLHRGFVHTPLVPFSVARLGAACGVMITASHNPKDDNGYKVYWQNAVQIISPYDAGIATAILENLEPRSWDTEIVRSSPLCFDVTQQMIDSYFSSLKLQCVSPTKNHDTKIKFINTSMHGVGHAFAVKAFETFGLPLFTAVECQKKPDPEFPTVKFPNPEEKGALDIAMKEANLIGASYILAQDPDADRFTAAEKGSDGKWTCFTGDQLGIIFAARCLDNYRASGKPLKRLSMVASTVSSKMLELMAAKEGFRFVECLTGFKYIGNAAQQLMKEGYDVPFGYEEAIGYMIGNDIQDKDGISASAHFAELAASLADQGLRVSDFLNGLYEKYGYFQTANSYFICYDASTIDKIFARLRSFNQDSDQKDFNYPRSIAGLKVTTVRDMTTGYDSSNPPSYKCSLPLSSGHMIQFRAQSLEGTIKIALTIRTSGTEPKIKFYLEGSGFDAKEVEKNLPKVIVELRDSWMEAEVNGLESVFET